MGQQGQSDDGHVEAGAQETFDATASPQLAPDHKARAQDIHRLLLNMGSNAHKSNSAAGDEKEGKMAFPVAADASQEIPKAEAQWVRRRMIVNNPFRISLSVCPTQLA